MDPMTRGGRLSPRARRALPLIAAAVLVATWASVAYLRPSLLQLPTPPNAVGPPLLSTKYTTAYTFLTPSLGWALVVETTSSTPRFSVFKTTDSAKHWKRLLVKQQNQIYADQHMLPAYLRTSLLIRFFDASHGVIALGYPAEIYRTSDGGTQWAPVKTPNYSDSSFVPGADAVHAWLFGWSATADQLVPNLLSTSDGGDTWTALPQPLPWANGLPPEFRHGNLSFRNPREGWVGAKAAEPTVYTSADGGASWQPHAVPSNLDPTLCAEPLPPGAQGPLTTYLSLLPGQGVVVFVYDYCGHGEAYTSLDGLATWRRLASPPGTTTWGNFAYQDSSHWGNFAYQDSSHWWAMGLGDLWKSSDAGLSWKLVSQQIDGWQYIPHVIDAKHAWAELFIPNQDPAGGPSGVPGDGAGGLAVTSDGGLHWSQVSSPKPG